MDKDPQSMDWSLVQSFLMVAETGSLSEAARRLNQSQPTIGRHIRALEKQLQTSLFERHQRGLNLTNEGAALVPHAKSARDSMQALRLTAAGQESQMEGTVRIACSIFAAHHILPGIIADMRALEPGIDFEIAPSDDSENLLYREADIAVRMYRPTQLDIVTRHIGDIPIGVFAAHRYLKRIDAPVEIENFFAHDVVGFDQGMLILNVMRALGVQAKPSDFAVRCDNQSAYWELVRAGCGIGFAQVNVGRAEPKVTEIDLGLTLPPLPVWLAAPEAMRQVPRLSRVWNLLADGLTEYVRNSHRH
ncbi:MAG: LysR family transcriptional regulator [Paracoccaceae bacterium]